MSKRYHVLYIAEDGITTLVSGVGTIAQNFLLAFPSVVEEFAKEKIDLSLSLVTLKTTQGTIGFRKDLKAASLALVKRYGGELHEITQRQSKQYFSRRSWKEYNQIARTIIQDKIKKGDHLIVIANDPIFGFSLVKDKRVTTILVPHSLAAVHRQSYLPLKERITWERQMFSQVQKSSNVFVGYTSYLWHEIFLNKYKLPITKLIPFYNGFATQFLKTYVLTQPEIKNVLQQYNIPTTQDLIVSYARPDEYKGLDVALQAMIAFAKQKKLHPVVIASSFSHEKIVAVVQDELSRIVERSSIPVTLVLGYEFDLPKQIIQWHKTKYLLNLPLRDFNPLVPLEGARLGHGDLIILNSDLPCHRVFFADNHSGFLAKPKVDHVVRRLGEIARMPKREVQSIIQRGRHEVEMLTSVSENILLGISSAINEHEFSAGAVIVRTRKGQKQVLLVEHKDQTYVFVKGHIEAGETPRQAAIREIFEEVGLRLKADQLTKPRIVSRMTFNKSEQRTLKHITIFQAHVPSTVKTGGGEEVSRWFSVPDALQVMRYPEDRLLLSTMKL